MELLRSRVSKIKVPGRRVKPRPVPFLAMPVWRYALFTLLSCGLYQLYWHFVNWKAVKTADESATSPFWRTVFLIFWIYPLFKRILGEAQRYKYPVKFSAGLLTSLYFVLYLISVPLGFLLPYGLLFPVSLATLALLVLLMIPVQRAANAAATTRNSASNSPTFGEVVLLLLGIVSFATSISMVVKMPNTTVLDDFRTQMSLVKQSFQLSAEYAQCSSDLNGRYALLNTNDQVAVDAYNADRDKCEAVNAELKRVVEESESRSGFYR